MRRGSAEPRAELAETWQLEPGLLASLTHRAVANDLHMWGARSLLELSCCSPVLHSPPHPSPLSCSPKKTGRAVVWQPCCFETAPVDRVSQEESGMHACNPQCVGRGWPMHMSAAALRTRTWKHHHHADHSAAHSPLCECGGMSRQTC